MLGGVSSPYLHALTCSKCGAALDPGSGAQILVCPYCQTSHVFAPPPHPAPIVSPRRAAPVAVIAGATVALVALAGAGLALTRAAPVEPRPVRAPAAEPAGE